MRLKQEFMTHCVTETSDVANHVLVCGKNLALAFDVKSINDFKLFKPDARQGKAKPA